MTRRGWFGSLVAGVAAWWWPKAPVVAPVLGSPYPHWRNYAYQYTSISKDELIKRMVAAWAKKQLEKMAAAGDYQI